MRFADLIGPIDWLVKAGLVYRVHVCTRPELPLVAFTKPNIFKLFVFDVGLLGCMLGIDPGTMVLQDTAKPRGISRRIMWPVNLYPEDKIPSTRGRDATRRSSSLLRVGGKIIPVEVKSGTRTRAQSLRTYIRRNTGLASRSK